MHCPFCQHPNNRVLESRSAEGGRSIRRRRECLKCEQRFTTYERIEHMPITVVKRSGERELFDRDKIWRGIIRACEKTDVAPDVIDSIVDDVEAEIQQRFEREVTSVELGDLVLQHLKQVNEVAYIRFASVYGKFKGIQDFIAALQQFSGDENAKTLDLSKLIVH